MMHPQPQDKENPKRHVKRSSDRTLHGPRYKIARPLLLPFWAPPLSKHSWPPEMFGSHKWFQPQWSTLPISFSDPTSQSHKVLRYNHSPIAHSSITIYTRHTTSAVDYCSRGGFFALDNACPYFCKTRCTPCPTSSQGARPQGHTSAHGAPCNERWPSRCTSHLVITTCLKIVSHHPVCSEH